MLYQVTVQLADNRETFKVNVEREEDIKTFVRLYYPEVEEFNAEQINVIDEEKRQ